MDDNSVPNICKKMDNFIFRIGNVAAWLNFFLLVIIILQISLRYIFGRGYVFLEELQWHLYAVAFMIALSYAQCEDNHIRLDIFSERFSKRTTEIIEIVGILILVLPFIVLLFIHGSKFVHDSWRLGESSGSPMGLPCRWIIKSFIPIGMVTLGISMVSRLIRAFAYLAQSEKG